MDTDIRAEIDTRPLLTVWADDALHLCTGTGEQKYRNLEHSPEVVLATGTAPRTATWTSSARARPSASTDEARPRALAAVWEAE